MSTSIAGQPRPHRDTRTRGWCERRHGVVVAGTSVGSPGAGPICTRHRWAMTAGAIGLIALASVLPGRLRIN